MSNPSWDSNLLLISLIITVALNGSVFLIAYFFQTDVLTDLTGSVNYIIVAVICFLVNGEMGTRQIGITTCIVVARVYLGCFLFYRASMRSGDSRFDGIRSNFLQFGTFWLFQIIWVWGTSLPVVYILSRTHDVDAKFPDFIAFAAFAIGFLFQSVGDIQKFRFKSSGQKGIMKTGLWSLSRHPNYFGEILMWYSIYAVSLIQWEASDDEFWWIIVNAFCPFFTTMILLFFSGMPTAEGSSLRRIAERGDLEEWNKYADETSPLIPWPCYRPIPDFLKLLCCCEFPMYKYNPKLNARYSSAQSYAGGE